MDSPISGQKSFLRHFLTFANSKSGSANTTAIISTVILLAVWLGIVIFTTTQHEFWRDEVRALSLVRAATSPLDLLRLTHGEGHPIIWYLLLYIGNAIANTPLVLSVTSILIAFAAVTVFAFYAPFPFWFRCMFILSLPLYEYSVMARNYGISILLLFVGASLYRNRAKHPLLLAVILALLANTNVHSVIFSCLIIVVWSWDTIVGQRRGTAQVRVSSLYLPFAIVIAGISLCIAFTMPGENTIVTSTRHTMSIPMLAKSSLDALLQPEQTFSMIAPADISLSIASLLLYLAVFGLLHRPNLFLAALGGQIAFGVFFRVVYNGSYRHQGLFLVFILFLYWLFIESRNNETITKTKRMLFNAGVFAVTVLILWNVAKATSTIRDDINQQMSSSKAFGEFLNTSATYRDAIIVPEPDYFLESLPYYAKNKIYLPREHRFGTTVSSTTEADTRLSLSELLSVARDIKARYNQPVLIVLGHREVDEENVGEKKFSYNKVFSWTADEFATFKESTRLVTEFKGSLSYEDYRVYTLR